MFWVVDRDESFWMAKPVFWKELARSAPEWQNQGSHCFAGNPDLPTAPIGLIPVTSGQRKRRQTAGRLQAGRRPRSSQLAYAVLPFQSTRCTGHSGCLPARYLRHCRYFCDLSSRGRLSEHVAFPRSKTSCEIVNPIPRCESFAVRAVTLDS